MCSEEISKKLRCNIKVEIRKRKKKLQTSATEKLSKHIQIITNCHSHYSNSEVVIDRDSNKISFEDNTGISDTICDTNNVRVPLFHEEIIGCQRTWT